MREIPTEMALWPERPPIGHGDTLNALRTWGQHDLADDLVKVLIERESK